MNLPRSAAPPLAHRTKVDHLLETLGAITGVSGATVLALNIPESPWGWVLFSVSNAAWLAFALRNGLRGMLGMYLVYTAIALLGIWRGLIA